MKTILKNVRLAFPTLFKPEQIMGEGDPKFGATLLIDKNDPQIKTIREGFATLAKDKWAAKGESTLSALISGGKVCLRDGDSKADYAGFSGCMFISANSKTRPLVVGLDKAPLVEADGKPYAGCYVNAVIDLWAQDNGFGKRINASLLSVQFFREGEAFSGGATADVDDFEDLSVDTDGLC